MTTEDTVARLRARVRSLRDQLERSLDARGRAMEIGERQAAQLEQSYADNRALRNELAIAHEDLAKARDALANERAEHRCALDLVAAQDRRNAYLCSQVKAPT